MKFKSIIVLVAVIFTASTDTVSAGAMTGFASITSGGVAGAAVSPVLVFTPATTVTIGGTITLTMPAGYFLGSVAYINSTVTNLTATSTSAATAASTTVVLTTAGAATGTAAITMTLTGLTLGGARDIVPAGFKISSSADTTLSTGLNTVAVTGLIFTSITSGGVAGAAVSPVLVFTPATTVTIGGTITLTMPAGYFLGSVTSIASGVTNLTATSTSAATATSTSIVLTTAGAATGTAAITMTLTGLTLGSVRAIVTGGFQMKTSADAGSSVGLDTAAITTNSGNITAPLTTAKSSGTMTHVSGLMLFLLAVFFI